MSVATPSMPHTVSKKELRRALHCTSARQWREKIFTDGVLGELEIRREEWNRVVVLDVQLTKKVIQFFELKPQDFAV